MARHQYRVSTLGGWTSGYGFAYFVLMNPSTSGRKMTLRSMEVINHTVLSGAPCLATLYRCASISGGDARDACSCRADTGTALPATVLVKSGGIADVYTSTLLHVDCSRQQGAVGTEHSTLFGKQSPLGLRRRAGGGTYFGPGTAASQEPLRINSGEAIALVMDSGRLRQSNAVRRVNITLDIAGKTVNYEFTALPIPGQALFSVESSGPVVKLIAFSAVDVGSLDTPTLRFVPVGALFPMDIADSALKAAQCSSVKMNTASPAFPGLMYNDIPIIPTGSPISALAEATAGSPKGLNYTQTRDFLGPLFRTALPEYNQMVGVGGASDSMGYTKQAVDMLCTRSAASPLESITLNPGEGLAIMSCAETAVAVATSWSGWPSLEFAAQVDSDPATAPSLTLTGLVDGTEVRVMTAGTQTLMGGVESSSGGSFTLAYDPDTVTSVDINVVSESYENIWYSALALGLAGSTIPVQQRTDRNYQP